MKRTAWAVAVVVGLAVAGRGRAEGPWAADLVADLDARWIAALDAQRGPVTFRQALVANVPSAAEVREAKERDLARPLVALIVDNPAGPQVKLELQLTLEDEDGMALERCSVSQWVGSGWNQVVENICRGTNAMPLREWTRVRSVHVVGAVRGR